MPAFPRAYSEVITHEQIMSQAMEGQNCVCWALHFPQESLPSPKTNMAMENHQVLVGDTSSNGWVFSLSC